MINENIVTALTIYRDKSKNKKVEIITEIIKYVGKTLRNSRLIETARFII